MYALHALLLVGMARTFGTVGHVQQSWQSEEFEEVSEVSNTSPKARISRWPCAFFVSLATAPLSCTHRYHSG